MGDQKYQWEKYQKQKQKYEEKLGKPDEIEIEDDGIDWHDFIVVQTIDLYDEHEDLNAAVNDEKQEMASKIDQIK